VAECFILALHAAFVAGAVGKVGFGVAVCAFIAMIVRWMVEKKGFPLKQINNNGPVQVQLPLEGFFNVVLSMPSVQSCTLCRNACLLTLCWIIWLLMVLA
jgi:hypothetical protein